MKKVILALTLATTYLGQGSTGFRPMPPRYVERFLPAEQSTGSLLAIRIDPESPSGLQAFIPSREMLGGSVVCAAASDGLAETCP